MLYHWCVRIYNNDDRTVEVRRASELPEWLDYNKTARFGNALFVDGKCVANGYLSQERCDTWAEKLTIEFANITQDQLQRNARPVARTVGSFAHRSAMGTGAHIALMGAALATMGATRLPRPPVAVQAPPKRQKPDSTTINLGRNAPCRCGSGKKSKRCCGKT